MAATIDLTGAAAGNATGVAVTGGSSSNVVGGSSAAARNVVDLAAALGVPCDAFNLPADKAKKRQADDTVEWKPPRGRPRKAKGE